MKITEAKKLAHHLMDVHQLDDWTFGLNNNKSAFGKCFESKKRIELSRPFIEINNTDNVRDTILHEIAHALAGAEVGHGKVWKEIAQKIGSTPRSINVCKATPKEKFKGVCPNCGVTIYRHRRNNLICKRCTIKFNKTSKIVWKQNK